MMKMFRSIVGFACLALAAALSCVGMASATEKLTSLHFRALAYDSGSYGAESAKLKAELAHMQAIGSERTQSSSGLLKVSNGFVQKALANVGVAVGSVGVGAGHPA